MSARVPDNLPPGLVVLVVACAGLVVLAAVAAWTAPPPVEIADLAAHEGARVQLDARVADAGPRHAALADETGRVTAFLSRHAPALAPGDDVTVVGTVGRAAEGFVVSAQTVRVVGHAQDRVLRVQDLADAPTRFDGTPVRVSGVLERVTGVGWHLADPFAGTRVLVVVSPVPDAWVEDAPVQIDGAFRLHARSLTYRVAVDAWSWA